MWLLSVRIRLVLLMPIARLTVTIQRCLLMVAEAGHAQILLSKPATKEYPRAYKQHREQAQGDKLAVIPERNKQKAVQNGQADCYGANNKQYKLFRSVHLTPPF